MSSPHAANGKDAARIGLVLGALGVVFGDIGTSPLYALRECFAALPAATSAAAHSAGILGALSLVFWSLVLVVNVKYVVFITKADNRGEGGVFALLALSHPDSRRIGLGPLTFAVLFGAALLYGDGVITPAISVLGAAEGLESFNPDFVHLVPVLSCAILAGLFFVQHWGTKAIGGIFGPAMMIWFFVIGCLGLWQVVHNPGVLWAINPMYGIRLLLDHPGSAFALLGAVVLAITGAEALYADMGHFGRKNISVAWQFLAFPALILNYFGQGAWALANPASTEHPFFALVPPGWPKLALTTLSIIAAIIASQAMITGTYSLTRQAIQLGYFPRLTILHTNPDQEGQIYLPLVNWALAFGSIATVALFKSSSALAAAYGIAVTGAMVITSIAFYRVTRLRWKWPVWRSGLLVTGFIALDFLFLRANLHKIVDGGWFPIAIALAMIAIMHTWNRGKAEIFKRVYSHEVTEEELCDIACSTYVTRVRGAAVFMAGNARGTPLVLLHHLKANKVLHETVILLTIGTEEVPSINDAERLTVREIGQGIWRAVGKYGYMESPDVEALMERIRAQGVPVKTGGAVYFFNREMIITGGDAPMWRWQKALYAWMSRNARPARDYYRIEPSQIIEVGLPVVL